MNPVTAVRDEPVQWDKALLDKYDIRGPRYTSYPTAAQFVEFGEADYLACLDELATRPGEPLSLYVHIPFCQDICYYCACNKIVTRNTSLADSYLGYLDKEMQLIRAHIGDQRPVTQLHLGGGTPTFLDAGQLTRLVYLLSRHFQLLESDDREYSIEIDPRTVSHHTLALLKGLGFNRISLGVQDFSDQVQQAVNRINRFEDVAALMSAARDYGYHSINLDLIYGLPMQTPDSLAETLEKVISLAPERIAFYNYAHMPERFSSQRAIDRLSLPTAEQKLEMLNLISRRLTEAGYCYIGMDHFVKPDDALAIAQRQGSLQRNFQGYSTCRAQDLVSLGVSAISNGQRYFAQNAKRLEDYCAALDAGHLPVEKGLLVSHDDEKHRFAIMQLISNLKLNIDDWQQAFADDFYRYFAAQQPALQQMADDGLLQLAGHCIEVTPKGRAMLRNICMIFDEYTGGDTQRFSKVL
ncbi:MAG TPA: oxygen-independent coproporphyrinogen III oxidase [Pseudomonadales bacterium]